MAGDPEQRRFRFTGGTRFHARSLRSKWIQVIAAPREPRDWRDLGPFGVTLDAVEPDDSP